MKSPKLLIFILFSAILLNSCKKDNGQFLTSQKTETVDLREYMSPEVFTFLKERFDKEGRSFTVNIDKKVEMYYSDWSGKLIESYMRRSFVSACTGFTDAYATLISYKQNYDCNNGYKLTWKYEISTDNNIVEENPYFPAQKTKGLIRIFNVGSGTPAYVQSTEDVEIIDLGPDLFLGVGYQKYSVEFTSDYISDFYINNANAYKLMMGATLAIDCDNGTAPVGITITDYGFPNYGSGTACDRNDKVWISPPYGSEGFTVVGVDPFVTCPLGYNYPTWQEVEYSVDGGTWLPIANFSSYYKTGNGPVYGSKYLARADVGSTPSLPSGTYTYIFRYRNVLGNDHTDISTVSCVNTFYNYEVWEATY